MQRHERVCSEDKASKETAKKRARAATADEKVAKKRARAATADEKAAATADEKAAKKQAKAAKSAKKPTNTLVAADEAVASLLTNCRESAKRWNMRVGELCEDSDEGFVTEEDMSEAQETWDAERDINIANLTDHASESIKNAACCCRRRSKTAAIVEAISPIAASLEHFPEIKRTCIQALRRKPDSDA
jgi:hypothetical protein